jgi:hypothetical protein
MHTDEDCLRPLFPGHSAFNILPSSFAPGCLPPGYQHALGWLCTPSVHDPYPIRTQSAHNPRTMAVGFRCAPGSTCRKKALAKAAPARLDARVSAIKVRNGQRDRPSRAACARASPPCQRHRSAARAILPHQKPLAGEPWPEQQNLQILLSVAVLDRNS